MGDNITKQRVIWRILKIGPFGESGGEMSEWRSGFDPSGQIH